MRELEFLPSWYPKLRQRQQLVKLQTTVSIAIIILLGAWAISARAGVSKQRILRGTIDERLSQSSEELTLLNEQVDLKAQLQKQKQIIDRMGRHVDATRMLTLLQSSLTRQMAMTELKISTIESVPQRSIKEQISRELPAIERKLQVNITGVAPSDLDISEFLEHLSKIRFCENVQLLEASDLSKDGHLFRRFAVTFSLNLTTNPSANSTGGGASW